MTDRNPEAIVGILATYVRRDLLQGEVGRAWSAAKELGVTAEQFGQLLVGDAELDERGEAKLVDFSPSRANNELQQLSAMVWDVVEAYRRSEPALELTPEFQALKDYSMRFLDLGPRQEHTPGDMARFVQLAADCLEQWRAIRHHPRANITLYDKWGELLGLYEDLKEEGRLLGVAHVSEDTQ